jgi:hypothetical protein
MLLSSEESPIFSNILVGSIICIIFHTEILSNISLKTLILLKLSKNMIHFCTKFQHNFSKRNIIWVGIL